MRAEAGGGGSPILHPGDDWRPGGWLRARLRLKRGFDVVAAMLSVVLLSPVLLTVAAVILLLEGRPVLFRQTRVGRFGRSFEMRKFRTMVPDAQDLRDELEVQNHRKGPLFKVNDDPRVTRVGRLLRRTSLDELPQLFNVIDGSMSLVGPRPSLYSEREHFPPELLVRERLPQGITGLWQLEGRLDPEFAAYRDLDIRYVEGWSLRRDAWLLARTPFVVLAHALLRTPVAIDAAERAASVAGAEATPIVLPRARDRAAAEPTLELAKAVTA